MLHDPRVLLMDVEQAGADIERFTEGATLGETFSACISSAA